jgi:hypothetical protein
MDRRRAFARFLTGAGLALALAGGRDAPRLPIKEAGWLAPGALHEGLTRQPRECAAAPRDAAQRRSAAIGRIAFGAPLLLGGQAARAGLSCASCHRNGRGNPDFLFPGLSGGPGTADVTLSLMSSHRGDGTDNPKPIPDLAGPAAARIVDRDPAGGALERFIRGLIVEEFDGPEPPPAVLAGLAAYVRTIGPRGCGKGTAPVRMDSRLADVETALRLADRADAATARLLIGAARSSLGAIDERFRLPGMEGARRRLREADLELRAILAGKGDMAGWLRRWPERKRLLLSLERRSLFAPAVLRRALG